MSKSYCTHRSSSAHAATYWWLQMQECLTALHATMQRATMQRARLVGLDLGQAVAGGHLVAHLLLPRRNVPWRAIDFIAMRVLWHLDLSSNTL